MAKATSVRWVNMLAVIISFGDLASGLVPVIALLVFFAGKEPSLIRLVVVALIAAAVLISITHSSLNHFSCSLG